LSEKGESYRRGKVLHEQFRQPKVSCKRDGELLFTRVKKVHIIW